MANGEMFELRQLSLGPKGEAAAKNALHPGKFPAQTVDQGKAIYCSAEHSCEVLHLGNNVHSMWIKDVVPGLQKDDGGFAGSRAVFKPQQVLNVQLERCPGRFQFFAGVIHAAQASWAGFPVIRFSASNE